MISVKGNYMKFVISQEHWAHNVCTLEQTPVGEQSHTCTEHNNNYIYGSNKKRGLFYCHKKSDYFFWIVYNSCMLQN